MSEYRKYFETIRDQEIQITADAGKVVICIDKDDDEQVSQITLDAHDAATLLRLLSEALTSLKAKDEREAA